MIDNQGFAEKIADLEIQVTALEYTELRVLSQMTLAELLHAALWVGGDTPRTRFTGLRAKLEQTGETLRMARTCHPRQS